MVTIPSSHTTTTVNHSSAPSNLAPSIMPSPSHSPISEEGNIEGRSRADTYDSEELLRQIQEAANTRRPSSIAEALSLENDLDDEHEHEHTHEEEGTGNEDEERTPVKTRVNGLGLGRLGKEPAETAADRRVSLDPHVLARIVENLRQDLTRVSQERDALQAAYEGAPLREKELKEALEKLTERNASLETEVDQLKRKSQEDEEQVSMLRTKVEESRYVFSFVCPSWQHGTDEDSVPPSYFARRRGLMRLQADANKSKRQSIMSVDTGRANGLLSFAGPSSSKRASFTPLTGSGVSNINGHRRISSISEPSFSFLDDDDSFAPPASGRSTALFDDVSESASVRHSRRASAFYAGGPLYPPVARSISPTPPQHAFKVEDSEEFKLLKKRCDEAMEALDTARQELQDIKEAREASEQCVAALRAFISEHGVGETKTPGGTLKLPPMPSEDVKDDDEDQPKRPGAAAAGFSFGKLFRGQGPANKQPLRTPRASQESNVMSPPPEPAATTPQAFQATTSSANANAFSRTFGGLFGPRKDSVSSVNTTSSAGTPPAETTPTAVQTTHSQPSPPETGETNSSTETAFTQSSAPIAISTTSDFLPPRLPNGLREREPFEPRPLATPRASDGLQEPIANGLGSDSEGEMHESESVSVEDPAEPASPEVPPSKHDGADIREHDATSVGSAGDVLGAAETGKAHHGVNADADGVTLTFA